MPGGTVADKIKSLQYSDTRITKDSFSAGYEVGKKMVMWTRYNRGKIVHVASTSQYLGARKDRTAYQVGIVVGYLDEAMRLGRISESEALTLDDLGVLGLKQLQPN